MGMQALRAVYPKEQLIMSPRPVLCSWLIGAAVLHAAPLRAEPHVQASVRSNGLSLTDCQGGAQAVLAQVQDAHAGATTSRLATAVGGSASATDSFAASADADSGFTLQGASTPLSITFHWVVSGGDSAVVDDSAFSLRFTAGASGPGQLEFVALDGLSFVDLPPAMGDFAGSATGTVAPHGAGFGLPSYAYAWNGQGSLNLAVENLYANGDPGSFGQGLEFGGRNMSAAYQIHLSAVTAQAWTQSAQAAALGLDGVHLLLDNGERIAVTM